LNRRTFLTAVGSAVLITSAGCTENTSQKEIMSEINNVAVLRPEGEGVGNDAKMLRFVDDEAGTLVYAQLDSMGIKSGGLAVLPLSETNFA